MKWCINVVSSWKWVPQPPVCSPSWQLCSVHSTLLLSVRWEWQTQKGQLWNLNIQTRQEEVWWLWDAAGRGARGQSLLSWVDGAVGTSLQGFQRCRSCPACLWALLWSVVHLFSHWLPVPCSVQQQKKKIEKRNKKFNKNENSSRWATGWERNAFVARNNLASEASARVVPKEQHNALPFPWALASFYLHFQIDQPGLGLPSRDYYECTGAYQEVRGADTPLLTGHGFVVFSKQLLDFLRPFGRR